MAKNNIRETQFWQFFQPVIDALNELGGSGQAPEIKEIIVKKLNLSEDDQEDQLPSGASRFSNKVDWARYYLSKSGYVDSSTRGVSSLTEKGRNAKLSNDDALQIVQTIRKEERNKQKSSSENKKENLQDEIIETNSDYRIVLLNKLMNVSPNGFERLCQRLLRESGFESVLVTGRSGDGGIDGNGLLQVNPFLSFKVLFQCKRYSGSVNASQVRDFRGAMSGRADKGIILTTGTFTSDARKEAFRDGVSQIELVDREKLIEMFEELELGLKPKMSYEVDESFFEDFN